MKKIGNVFIKNLRYLCLAGVAALGLMTIVATGGSGGSVEDTSGTAPKIDNAYFWNVTNSCQTDVLYLETQMYALYIHCHDPDLDMVRVWMTVYKPADASDPYSGPDFLELSPQTEENMIYVTESFVVEGEPGERRLELQLEDAKGNESNIYTFYYRVEETAPSTPTNVSATLGDEEVTISWDSVLGATSYNIYWSTSFGVSKDTYEGKIPSITTTSYLHTGLTNGTIYYYVVTAENDYGESDESDEVSATPGRYPHTVVDTISVGGMPESIAVTPDGSYVYVANQVDDTVSVIQTSDNTVIDTISVGDHPYCGIAVTPNGDYLYVANSGDNTVSVIQTSDNTVIDTIYSVGNDPLGIAVTPDGSYVYVTIKDDDTVSVIQTSDNTVIDTISVGDHPYGVAVTPNGSYLYVSNIYDDTVSVIRTSDNTLVDTISVGDGPIGVAVTPDGSYVYVANLYDDRVSVIQTLDNTVIKTIYSVGNDPLGIAVTPDGSYVYVTIKDDDTVSVIQTSDNTVIDTISVGSNPRCVAVTPNGSYVYVTSGDVSVIGFSE